MKEYAKYLRVVIVAFAAVLPVLPAMAATETFHEAYAVKAGTPLTVSNRNGSITVRAWENETVDVMAEKKASFGGRVADVDIQVTAGDVLSVKTVYLVNNPRVSVNYTISVPAGLLVQDLRTSNGAITVQGTTGDLIAETSNGAIKIMAHNGSIQVETSNGGVDVHQIAGLVTVKTSNGAINIVDAAGIGSARTSNGSIHAEVADIAGDTAELKTSNGAIKVFLSPELDADLALRTSNGKISVQNIEMTVSEISKTSLKGRLGDGGPALNVKTSNGTIEVYELK